MAVAQILAEPPATQHSPATAAMPAASVSSVATRRLADRSSAQGDPRRAWIWWFLAVLVASQLYFVRELVAAFALFAVGFVMIAAVAGSFYLLTKACHLAVERLAELRHPAVAMAPAHCEQRKAV